MGLLEQVRKEKIFPPAQKYPLEADVILLRKLNMNKVPDGIYDLLAKQHIVPGVAESRMPWFNDGYISNDTPRDTLITDEIMHLTTGFAVARTDTGEIMKEYGKADIQKADYAVRNARTQLAIEVDLGDDVVAVDDEDLEDDK